VLSAVPDNADPSQRYVIYLHGRIIETSGRRPEHPMYGIYEYDEILGQLANDAVIISQVRPADTDIAEYAASVAQQVEDLLAQGVPEEHITIVGFSKGGVIAILTAARLANDRISFVLQAACGSWLTTRPELVPYGRMLSLYESSDNVAGSCSELFARRDGQLVWEELELALGGGHGAFYRPDPGWMTPTRAWINQRWVSQPTSGR